MITGMLPIKGLNVADDASELAKNLGICKPIKNVAASSAIQLVTCRGMGEPQ